MATYRTSYCLGMMAVLLVGSSAGAAPAPGSVALERATLTAADGTVVAYELGTLHVLENRAAPHSRVISIGFARLRATRPTKAPPIIVLPGGPGTSYLDAFTDTGENARRRLAMFRSYSTVADVVVFDQRGFSKRGEVLRQPTAAPLPLDRPSTVQMLAEAWRAYAAAAVEANPGRDLSGYDIAQCAADVDELRAALGYTTVSLLGSSFGSQWSFAVMRRYPGSVARAVLSGVEPLDHGFDMPSQTFAALQRIAFEADRAPGLQPYLPAGGLIGAVRELRDRFARGPVTVRVTDPATGKPVSVVLGLEDLQGAIVPGKAEGWPAWVLAIYHGHYEAWALAELAARRTPSFTALITPLIDAGLGATAARVHQLETDPATHLIGTWGFQPYHRSRAAWPTADAGDALRVPVTSQIPVVFVTGDWDTSTPVENALAIAPYFPRSHTTIVHRGPHGMASFLTSGHPAVFDAILEFLRSGATARLPAEIARPAPSFTLPAFPAPTPRAPRQSVAP